MVLLSYSICCISDMTSKRSGKKRRADDTGSDSDSSADEQDLEAFHRRMNEDDQETGGG